MFVYIKLHSPKFFRVEPIEHRCFTDEKKQRKFPVHRWILQRPRCIGWLNRWIKQRTVCDVFLWFIIFYSCIIRPTSVSVRCFIHRFNQPMHRHVVLTLFACHWLFRTGWTKGVSPCGVCVESFELFSSATGSFSLTRCTALKPAYLLYIRALDCVTWYWNLGL
jgi:hypothetical protein